MKIAILSGKGGTGKTLVSVNLASVINNATYIDCDVEEPNGNLFFKSKDVKENDVKVELPKFNKELCIGCKKCVQFCKFNALAYVKDNLIVFDDVCHSCKGCLKICPTEAITTRYKAIGKILIGRYKDLTIKSGILNIGEASGVPIIKELIDGINTNNVIIDCPPGCACSVMECIKDADYCILVAEPTIFGVHNLNMVYELVKLFNKKFGVILNKNIKGENISEEYCSKHNINILGKINWDKNLADLSTNCKIATEESLMYKELFEDIRDNILKEVKA